MSPVKLSIRRPVTTIMCICIVALAGIISLFTLKMDLMPTVDIPIAVVSTTYVGAGPEEIENLITKPVEEAVGTVSNVDTVSSSSSANSSLVMIQFVNGTDIDIAAADLRERIDMIKSSLPEDASEPLVMKIDLNEMSSIVVSVGSKNMDIPSLTTFVDENIQKEIEKINGVASVSLTGGIVNEVSVTLDSGKMASYGLAAAQVSSILVSENINLPVGTMKDGSTEITAKTVGEFKSITDIENVIIPTPMGSNIRLKDIAEIKLQPQKQEAYVTVDGNQAIALSISKQSNANLVEICDKINERIEELSEQFPDIEIKMLSDTSSFIKMSVKNVVLTAFQAALLAVVVLFIFLRSASTSAIIAVSIPTSIVATFALMYVFDMTLNIISLGGITLGIGMLVDNSVVVLENIYTYYSKGYSAKEAAQKGAEEVGLSVSASTLTTLAVFIPLMFVTGPVGQVFKDLSLTVCFSLGASLIISLTFVPMACSKLLAREDIVKELKVNKKETPVSKFLDKWGLYLEKIDSLYRKKLHQALNNKKKFLLGVFAAFGISLIFIPIAGFELFPEMDQGMATITVNMPSGTVVDETSAVVTEVLNRIDDIEETASNYVITGSGSSDSASINLTFVKQKDRKRSTDKIVDEIKDRIKTIPGAEITVVSATDAMGSFASSNDIQVQISGDDIDILRKTGFEIESLLETQPWAKNITNSSGESKTEVAVIINREKTARYGLSTATVAGILATTVNGTTATTYRVDGTEVDVVLKSDENRISYINDLQKVLIPTSTGFIPLTDVCDVVTEESAASISRINNHQYITIGFDTVDMSSAQGRAKFDELMEKHPIAEGCSYDYTGEIETLVDTFRSLFIAFIAAILLVYMIMAAQFESFVHPFIIMFSIPLAVTGGALGTLISGDAISAVSFMGFIMLVGMVVNNAIVLIDYTNQLRDRGMKCDEALETAGPGRLRPILMTTLTTIMGMVPMAIATSEGTEMQKPLAMVIIFGLAISSLITLFLIPILYSIVEKYRIAKAQKREEKFIKRKTMNQ